MFLHKLGFHGRNWSKPYWYLGNVWVSCSCGKNRQLGGDELSRIPADQISGSPDDGLLQWRKQIGITVVCATLLISASAALANPAVIPDNRITPGVSATTDVKEICGTVGGLTYSKRHRHTTMEMKRQAFKDSGVPYPPAATRKNWEVDHRCELSIGCADARKNLWAQYGLGDWNFHVKDKLEDRVHTLLCTKHTLTPKQAQAIFLAPADWRVGYCKYFTTDPKCRTLSHARQSTHRSYRRHGRFDQNAKRPSQHVGHGRHPIGPRTKGWQFRQRWH